VPPLAPSPEPLSPHGRQGEDAPEMPARPWGDLTLQAKPR